MTNHCAAMATQFAFPLPVEFIILPKVPEKSSPEESNKGSIAECLSSSIAPLFKLNGNSSWYLSCESPWNFELEQILFYVLMSFITLYILNVFPGGENGKTFPLVNAQVKKISPGDLFLIKVNPRQRIHFLINKTCKCIAVRENLHINKSMHRALTDLIVNGMHLVILCRSYSTQLNWPAINNVKQYTKKLVSLVSIHFLYVYISTHWSIQS